MAGDVAESLAEACADLVRAMARSDADETVLPGVAVQAAQLLGVRAAGVLLRTSDGHIDVASAADALIESLSTVEQDLGEGPTLEAFTSGDAVRVNTLADAGQTWPRWIAEARARGVDAWLAVPSHVAGTTVVVCASSTRPRHWQDCEVRAARVLADLAGGWIVRAHELDRVRRDAARLQDALDHRLVIEQAKGIIAGELGCTLDQAFAMLRDHARRNNVTVRSVAHAVVGLGLRPPAPHTHQGVT